MTTPAGRTPMVDLDNELSGADYGEYEETDDDPSSDGGNYRQAYVGTSFDHLQQAPPQQSLSVPLWPNAHRHPPTCRLSIMRREADGNPYALGTIPHDATVDALLVRFPKPGQYHVTPVDQHNQKVEPRTPAYVYNIPEDHEGLKRARILAGAHAAGIPTTGGAIDPGLLSFMEAQLKIHKEAADRAAQEAADLRKALLTMTERRGDEQLSLAEQNARDATALQTKLVDNFHNREQKLQEADRNRQADAQKQLLEGWRAMRDAEKATADQRNRDSDTLHATVLAIINSRAETEEKRLQAERARLESEDKRRRDEAKAEQAERDRRWEAEMQRQREHQNAMIEAQRTALEARSPEGQVERYLGLWQTVQPIIAPLITKFTEQMPTTVICSLADVIKSYVEARGKAAQAAAMSGLVTVGPDGQLLLPGGAADFIEEDEPEHAPGQMPSVQASSGQPPVQPNPWAVSPEEAAQAAQQFRVGGAVHVQGPPGVPAPEMPQGQAHVPAQWHQPAPPPVQQPVPPQPAPAPAPTFVHPTTRPEVQQMPAEALRVARALVRALLESLHGAPAEQWTAIITQGLTGEGGKEAVEFLKAATIYAACREAGADHVLAERVIAAVDATGMVPPMIPRR